MNNLNSNKMGVKMLRKIGTCWYAEGLTLKRNFLKRVRCIRIRGKVHNIRHLVFHLFLSAL